MNVLVVNSAQHRQMIAPVLDLFGIVPDIDLRCMVPNQTLSTLTSRVLIRASELFGKQRPDLVFVQGDTTTAAAAALAAYYCKIPVAHVEAGLRTHNRYSPFPEEINRQIIGRIAEYHFAPTMQAKRNLLQEGIENRNILVCGNSAIDALLMGLKIVEQKEKNAACKLLAKIGAKAGSRIILVTGHRRENFGAGLKDICNALIKLSQRFSDVTVVYPVHLNPNVQKQVYTLLSGKSGIVLTAPLDYANFILLMREAYLILTDSGGVQEEAPALGKPILVMRNNTERPEGIAAGTALLVGTSASKIFSNAARLLSDEKIYKQMGRAQNPYGDGTTAERIFNYCLKRII